MCCKLNEFVLEASLSCITVYIVSKEEHKNSQGIHVNLSLSDEQHLFDQLNTAERDGFTTIYLHI